MNKIKFFITKQKINHDKKLNYLITIPCVNREERNAINVIDKTFNGLEKSGLFESNINLTILLFESGSKDISYLDFIHQYIDKYCNKNSIESNIKIHIIYSNIQLNGNTNTLRMFFYINKLPKNTYDFVLWMDDDIYVCKNFIKNADIWIKNYSNFSIFSSLYVPYNSFYIKNRKNIQLANLPGFFGTCCTIFKPELSKFILLYWNNKHFEDFEYNPDARFRDCVRHFFPSANKICVSFPSLVEHMNIGSAIKGKKVVNKGHKALYFIGEDKDPEFYVNDLIL
jgi:hypothetical protein